MITVITGTDGSGKSTLVKKLQQMTGWSSRHFDKPKDLADGRQQYFSFASVNKSNIICDRYHEGEWVYAPLYRGYIADYLEEFEKAVIKNNNILMVYLKADLQTILERTQRRGEDFVRQEDFQTVLDSFEKFFEKQSLPFMVIDTTNSNTENNSLKVYDSMNHLDEIWNSVRGFDNHVDGLVVNKKILPKGNIRPTFMIVESNFINTDDMEPSLFFNEKLKSSKSFMNSWFTNLIPFPVVNNEITEEQVEATKHIFLKQYSLLQPEKVIATDSKTKFYLEKLLPSVKIYGSESWMNNV